VTTVTRGADGLWSWSRQLWDPSRGLVANPPGGYAELGPFAGTHLIRETVWFALDALAHGETAVAVQALTTVLARQYDRPGKAWHGTFPIFDHDPEPGDDAIMWLSYDPNWRQFVGVALAMIVEQYRPELPVPLVRACEEATRRCVAGEPPGRIPASYTNPALMHAWLCHWVGRRFGDATLSAAGVALGAEVMALFDVAGAVPEFNSPTYDGVNLMAATLWATAEEPFAGWGRRLVDSLLDSLGFLYHPLLHNLSGPYTRAYGMDMGSRITLYGLWRLVARDDGAALPPLDGTVEHSHDLFFAPLVDWAARRSPRPFPDDNVTFPRQRSFALGGGRTATAHLDRDVMIGAETGGRDGLVWDQYVPGSVHWTQRGVAGARWLRVHGGPAGGVDCHLSGAETLIVRSSTPVIMTTNGAVQRLPAGSLRLGGRVRVDAAGGLDVEETPMGGRITAHPDAAPVAITVDRVG
jgi:hypothetical protein